MNRLIKLTEKQKRSIELKTVGHLTKLLANASDIELTERIPYMVKRFETLLNEEISVLTFDKLEAELEQKATNSIILDLQKEKRALQNSLRDMANQLNEAKMNVERLKKQIK